MQNYKFILVLVLVVTFPNIPQAKMYKWVDENGKVTYSNTAPPSSAQKVETSKETTESSMDRAIRIENERIQREETTALKENQEEQRRILRTEQGRIKAEQKRANSIQRDQRRDILLSKESIKQEKNKLINKERLEKDYCRSSGKKRDARKKCVQKVTRKYRKKQETLRIDPKGYYAAQERKGQQTEGRVASRNNQPTRTYADGENDAWLGQPQESHGGEYAAGYEDEEDRETNRNSTINGEWDTQGRHYSPAGGGNAWRNDGTFMQKAAGGYIDTKTGQYVPAN